MLFITSSQVEVLGSLQRPKKITVLASDGKSYILLCKPKVSLCSPSKLSSQYSIVQTVPSIDVIFAVLKLRKDLLPLAITTKYFTDPTLENRLLASCLDK